MAGSITAPARRRVRAAVGLNEDGALTVWLQRGITFVLATGAWVFFQAATLETAGQMYAGLLSGPLWVFTSIGLDRWTCWWRWRVCCSSSRPTCWSRSGL